MTQLLIFSFFISVTYAILLRSEIERLKVINDLLPHGSFLKQLAIANESIGGGVIVVLAERDKEEMEMDIAKLEFDLMGSWVICRSGSPLILADLKKVSVSTAHAIIVLAFDENAEQVISFDSKIFYLDLCLFMTVSVEPVFVRIKGFLSVGVHVVVGTPGRVFNMIAKTITSSLSRLLLCTSPSSSPNVAKVSCLKLV
ncbi:hypothetical protein ACS0TY_000256 [Phlomoides rotata]